MGCIHHLIKFAPKLAEQSEPLRPLLSKTNTKTQNKLDWKDHHTTAFAEVKKQIIKITENKPFDINKETRVKFDASKKGLGACLEQKHNSTWKPIACASCFLNKWEERNSTNELELLAIVWALEDFNYYLYGNQFILQTYHQALLLALKNNRGNETYQSRLARWVDRLLPLSFTIENIPGKAWVSQTIWAEILLVNLHQKAKMTKNFVVNTIQEIKHACLIHIIGPTGKLKPTDKSIQSKCITQIEQNDVIHTKQNTLTKNTLS